MSASPKQKTVSASQEERLTTETGRFVVHEFETLDGNGAVIVELQESLDDNVGNFVRDRGRTLSPLTSDTHAKWRHKNDVRHHPRLGSGNSDSVTDERRGREERDETRWSSSWLTDTLLCLFCF